MRRTALLLALAACTPTHSKPAQEATPAAAPVEVKAEPVAAPEPAKVEARVEAPAKVEEPAPVVVADVVEAPADPRDIAARRAASPPSLVEPGRFHLAAYADDSRKIDVDVLGDAVVLRAPRRAGGRRGRRRRGAQRRGVGARPRRLQVDVAAGGLPRREARADVAARARVRRPLARRRVLRDRRSERRGRPPARARGRPGAAVQARPRRLGEVDNLFLTKPAQLEAAKAALTTLGARLTELGVAEQAELACWAPTVARVLALPPRP